LCSGLAVTLHAEIACGARVSIVAWSRIRLVHTIVLGRAMVVGARVLIITGATSTHIVEARLTAFFGSTNGGTICYALCFRSSDDTVMVSRTFPTRASAVVRSAALVIALGYALHADTILTLGVTVVVA